MHRPLRRRDLDVVRRARVRGLPADAGATPTRRSQICATARTPTSRPPSTRASARLRTCSTGWSKLHGKELSFNNLLDLSSARELVEEFDEPACAIVKHNNPCGCAIGASGQEAYEQAFACDPESAYGGVIAVNRPVDLAFAEQLGTQFIEVLLAPGYDAAALEALQVEEKRASAGAGASGPRRCGRSNPSR